jgi:cyclophilin family peptidyl-prolyl cis-trans isomerase
MSATTPQLEGTQAPSQIEFLYERYRPLLKWVLIVLVLVLAGYYGLKLQRQAGINTNWSRFSASVGVGDTYADSDKITDSLADALAARTLTDLEKEFTQADPAQRPYVLLAIARKAMQDKNFDRAESALAQLEADYPKHSLLQGNEYPVQVRDVIKQDKPATEKPTRNKRPDLKPAKAGSLVALLREQIATAKVYAVPAQFARVEVPADATKIKFELSGQNGSFVIALMSGFAPKQCEEFRKLAETDGGFWKDLNIDEIQRNGKGMGSRRPMQLHLGFASTKETDRTKWSKTDPSTHQVDFEKNTLSHFQGAVSAREGVDGKSCADRFWIAVEDAAEEDGTRVVFAYVIEGLENLKKVCEVAMTGQEDEAGIGMPTDKITVTKVTIL